MQSLLDFQSLLLRSVNNDFRRYLHQKINWKQRMIGIKGPRGSGKTTLMLQHLKFDLKNSEKALYITADHTWFYNHTLLDTATEWFTSGGEILFIDEVHKYSHWARELKNIYDGLPELMVVFSASSALDIYRGEADLSRRIIHYNLAGLSFREYLQFTGYGEWPAAGLEEIIKDHIRITREITIKLNPLPLFKQYLEMGYLPIIGEGEEAYPIKLEQIVNAVIESDLQYTSGNTAGASVKLKKLLGVIAESAPFKPNISAIASKLQISRDFIYDYIQQLTNARLLNGLLAEGKGTSTLQKPDKLFLENTNLAYALCENPDLGNLRETFLLNQLLNSREEVTVPEQGDFFVKGYHVEVGGKAKTARQVKHKDRYIVAADGIETGFGTQIPLWLFGFMY